jgi:hypothetical protein
VSKLAIVEICSIETESEKTESDEFCRSAVSRGCGGWETSAADAPVPGSVAAVPKTNIAAQKPTGVVNSDFHLQVVLDILNTDPHTNVESK